jgi:hypothetical protein
MSGPMRRIQFHGITKSSFGGHTPNPRHRPGTTIATTCPSGTSIRQSETNPKRRPSQIQITSLHRSSENLHTIKLPLWKRLCQRKGF